jgi:hypothetical protein
VNLVIQEWERKAVDEFGYADALRRSINYDTRNYRVTKRPGKRTSTVQERQKWIVENSHLSLSELLLEYCHLFNKTRNTYFTDKRKIGLF